LNAVKELLSVFHRTIRFGREWERELKWFRYNQAKEMESAIKEPEELVRMLEMARALQNVGRSSAQVMQEFKKSMQAATYIMDGLNTLPPRTAARIINHANKKGIKHDK
jgi:hypothetical protein